MSVKIVTNATVSRLSLELTVQYDSFHVLLLHARMEAVVKITTKLCRPHLSVSAKMDIPVKPVRIGLVSKYCLFQKD